MMNKLVSADIEAYPQAHSMPESDLCRALREETQRRMEAPQMIVGPLEGAFLKMMTQLVQATSVLEIGMFTGYSALCFAEALPADGTVITCEVDEESVALARRYFACSPIGKKIEVRMGPALTQAVLQGVMEYCLHINQCRGTTAPSMEPAGLTINSLLIGSNTSANIAVEDSVNAIVRGVVLANHALVNRGLKEEPAALPRVTHIQFVELYLDVAIDAAKSAHRVAKRIERELQTDIEVEPYLKKGKGGQARLVPSSSRGYWRRWTVTAIHDGPASVPLSSPPVLKDRLRSILREDKAQDPHVWSALLDLAFKDSGPLSHRPRKLRFLALSDRARAKVIVQESQSELIAQLIQRSITSTAFRRDIAKTLFTLLIPPDLKDSLLNQDRVVFILDDVTANYPWELMIATDQPLCVCMGMIRQLETADYVERVRDTTSTSVYVVGDPLTPSNYPELHGARKEADLVASLLKEYQYTVNRSSQRLGALEV